jgi:hypothetical protein
MKWGQGTGLAAFFNMNIPRLLSYNLAIFRIRTEELLEIEWIAKVVYGFYAAISFAAFFLAMAFRTPLRFLFDWTQHIVAVLLGDGSFWFTLYITSLIFFIPFAHYCVGAYGPGLLRRLLYRIIVQPRLDHIYRENHEEMPGPHQTEARAGFWLRLREGFSLTRLSLTPRRKGYVRLPPDMDESSDALSLHNVPSNGEDLGDTIGRDSDQNATDDHQSEEQQDESRESSERARRNGAKFGTWIGSKVGAAFSFPLKAAVRLGDLSTEIGNKVQAMRSHRLQRERREDWPGDIYLP